MGALCSVCSGTEHAVTALLRAHGGQHTVHPLPDLSLPSASGRQTHSRPAGCPAPGSHQTCPHNGPVVDTHGGTGLQQLRRTQG